VASPYIVVVAVVDNRLVIVVFVAASDRVAYSTGQVGILDILAVLAATYLDDAGTWDGVQVEDNFRIPYPAFQDSHHRAASYPAGMSSLKVVVVLMAYTYLGSNFH
jgi:hypothetical protein